jgi:hypothetical protein
MASITNKFRFLTGKSDTGVTMYGLLNGRLYCLPENQIQPYSYHINEHILQSQVGELCYREVALHSGAYMIFAILDYDGDIFYTQSDRYNRGLLPTFFLQNSFRYHTCEYIYIPPNARI